MMNTVDIILIIIIGAVFVSALIKTVKDAKNGRKCCGCGNCDKCRKPSADDKKKN